MKALEAWARSKCLPACSVEKIVNRLATNVTGTNKTFRDAESGAVIANAKVNVFAEAKLLVAQQSSARNRNKSAEKVGAAAGAPAEADDTTSDGNKKGAATTHAAIVPVDQVAKEKQEKWLAHRRGRPPPGLEKPQIVYGGTS
eukprot:g12614.t1